MALKKSEHKASEAAINMSGTQNTNPYYYTKSYM